MCVFVWAHVSEYEFCLICKMNGRDLTRFRIKFTEKWTQSKYKYRVEL